MKCKWKLIPPTNFEFGMAAERCGQIAAVRVIRKDRDYDLYLCVDHLNSFIEIYGLKLPVEILNGGE